MRTKARRAALGGLFTAAALILSFIETLLPPVTAAAPGIKLGLANTVVIFVLYRYGAKFAAAVSGARVLISGLLFGAAALPYSAAGAALSLCAMALMKKSRQFSAVGVSLAGALSHNAGQILAAMLLLGRNQLYGYFLPLAAAGAVTGVFIGILSSLLLRFVPGGGEEKKEKDAPAGKPGTGE